MLLKGTRLIASAVHPLTQKEGITSGSMIRQIVPMEKGSNQKTNRRWKQKVNLNRKATVLDATS